METFTSLKMNNKPKENPWYDPMLKPHMLCRMNFSSALPGLSCEKPSKPALVHRGLVFQQSWGAALWAAQPIAVTVCLKRSPLCGYRQITDQMIYKKTYFSRNRIANYTCPACYCFTRKKTLVSLALPGTANHVFPSFIMMGLFKRQCPRGSPASCQNVIYCSRW